MKNVGTRSTETLSVIPFSTLYGDNYGNPSSFNGVPMIGVTTGVEFLASLPIIHRRLQTPLLVLVWRHDTRRRFYNFVSNVISRHVCGKFSPPINTAKLAIATFSAATPGVDFVI
ncbi:hypothetical protein L798_01895 [Zootermopsis nevadensis]|uniref:Uncharacterized protein n=1 Tax=Zootermopsis nevadensis TaxID=136037 RepID=A0A067QI37_ZOONE|nr:hypothetical protein L798_01895 [Zootermopsis nevadensis]